MKILVTGGAGFIGKNFIREFDGKDVFMNLDKMGYASSKEGIPHTCLNVEGDIRNHDLVSSLLDQFRPDCLVNFAAETHVDRSIDSATPFIDSNVYGVFSLLSACRQYLKLNPRFRFVQISTDEVYGPIKVGSWNENDRYNPRNPYAATKAAGNHLVRSYCETYDFPAIITLGANTYGPYQFPEKLIPLMVAKAMRDESLPVYGDGLQRREWLSVRDHCHAIRFLIDNGQIGEEYNIGGTVEKTNLHVVNSIVKRIGKGRIEHVDDRPGHDRRYSIDPFKLKSLGWVPKVDLDTGLSETIDWYQDNLDWVESFEDYSQERLGIIS